MLKGGLFDPFFILLTNPLFSVIIKDNNKI